MILGTQLSFVKRLIIKKASPWSRNKKRFSSTSTMVRMCLLGSLHYRLGKSVFAIHELNEADKLTSRQSSCFDFSGVTPSPTQLWHKPQLDKTQLHWIRVSRNRFLKVYGINLLYYYKMNKFPRFWGTVHVHYHPCNGYQALNFFDPAFNIGEKQPGTRLLLEYLHEIVRAWPEQHG